MGGGSAIGTGLPCRDGEGRRPMKLLLPAYYSRPDIRLNYSRLFCGHSTGNTVDSGVKMLNVWVVVTLVKIVVKTYYAITSIIQISLELEVIVLNR